MRAIKAIIETYAKVRSMVRDMKALQTEKAGSPEQANMLTRAGHKLASLIGDNLSTVSRKTTIELNRYLGEWYEIARFDHSFERGVEQAKANYTQNADGTIKVVNFGIKKGKPKTAIGKGKTTDTPGLLRVSFFGPFYADYRVMLIDKDYSHALVGSGSADYLWILSRTSGLSETAKSELLAEARRRGYVTDKLIWVKQK